MTDQIIKAKAADYHRYGTYKTRRGETVDPQHINTVRVWNHSPERIAVQVRTDKGYATALLEPINALAYAHAILAAVDGRLRTASYEETRKENTGE